MAERRENKLLSRVVRSGERPKGRMMAIGSHWTYQGEYRSVDDDLRAYETVTLSDSAVRGARPLPAARADDAALGPLERVESSRREEHDETHERSTKEVFVGCGVLQRRFLLLAPGPPRSDAGTLRFPSSSCFFVCFVVPPFFVSFVVLSLSSFFLIASSARLCSPRC